MAHYAGIDFGTSNCTAGWLNAKGEPQLALLDGDSHYLSSALYIERPRADDDDDDYISPALTALLRQGAPVSLGQAAHQRYSQDPLGGIFIRSPKSMLGSRLTPAQASIYQQVCGLMLGRIAAQLPTGTEHVVIGRPIHFQGIDGASGDDRAEAILRSAAQHAGFRHIEFAYEPVAAAMEYERTLGHDQQVLVVDIGGGTSDLSLIRLGPSRRHTIDRSNDLLGHAGKRIGGVDMDIKLAIYGLMPLLGRGSLDSRGKPLPSSLFSDAVNIIDIHAQERFYHPETAKALSALLEIADDPLKIVRFASLYRQHLSYDVVQRAEQAKIALSSRPACDVDLSRIDAKLTTTLSAEQLLQAIYLELNGIRSLIEKTLQQAQCQPDAIFITGGASAIAGLRQLLDELLPGVPQIRGDQFGSVGKGLCSIAHRLFGA